MSTALEIGLLSVAGLYAAMLVAVYLGFLMRTNFHLVELPEKKISVVVAVRNEEKNISALLTALNAQTVLPSEVIIVDDSSEDGTVAKVNSFTAKYDLRCISSDGQGKKAALTRGIAAAQSEVILVTDGDCVPGEKWVESFAHIFSEDKAEFAAGMVKYSDRGGLLRHVLQTEMTFLQIASAGLYEFGAASMCNGASMGFTRKFFKEAGGFCDNKYVSGDDVLLLHKAMQRNKSTVKWNYERGAIVKTDAAKNVSEAIVQRHRWLSKFRGYRSVSLVASGILFLLVQLLLPAALIATLIEGSLLNPFAYAAGVKILVELLFLSLSAPYFGEQKIIPLFPLSVILYDMISLGAALRMFTNDVTWKNRKWKRGELV